MTRRRKMLIGVGVGLGVLAIIAAAVIFAFWDRATPISADDVAATLEPGTGGGMPGDPGLYVYETTGFETTDALGGARHEYPAETYLSIQSGGCGTLVRWQALEQRWTEWDYCDDLRLAGWDAYHEWFSVPNLDDWVCPEPAPTAGEPGDSWSVECSKGDTSQIVRYEVIGIESLDVGGEPVETLHTRTTSSSKGETGGSGTTDIWTLQGTALVVQRVVDTTSVTETRIGGVEYHEEYRVILSSLSPSR